jgi:hypothetical protein
MKLGKKMNHIQIFPAVNRRKDRNTGKDKSIRPNAAKQLLAGIVVFLNVDLL